MANPQQSPSRTASDADLAPPVAVVIPAYRAAKHIRAVLAGVPASVRHIVVVDDGSPDDSADLVRACGDPRVHLVTHAHNQGVGGAMLSGYDAARDLGATILVKMDADDQMDPTCLQSLIQPLVDGEADYTKGNRFLRARELRSMPVLRRVGNAGLSFLAKVASGYWNVFDPTNGYTALHVAVLPLLERTNIDRRYFFETSLLIELSLVRAVVRDVSIPARYGDEQSSLSEWDALWRFPRRLLRGLLRRLLVQYFVRDFTAFSLFLLAGTGLTTFGATWGLWHWLGSFLTQKVASTGTVMIAVLPIFLGIQFLLQSAALDMQSVPTQPIQRQVRRSIDD